MQTSTIDKEWLIYQPAPSQAEIDAAYALRIFLRYHPGRSLSLPMLIWQSGIPEERLKAAFWHQFNERLEEYWEKTYWAPSGE
jgi:hypothetical protein